MIFRNKARKAAREAGREYRAGWDMVDAAIAVMQEEIDRLNQKLDANLHDPKNQYELIEPLKKE